MARIKNCKSDSPLCRGVAHLCVQSSPLPVHCQGSFRAVGLHGAQPCHWLLWRREAPSPQGGLVGCKHHRSQPSWWCGFKWEENWALTSNGLPDLSLVAGLIVTQCLKKTWFVQTVYIFLYIPIYIYNLYKHTMKESQGLKTGKESSAFCFRFFFFLLSFFNIYSNVPVLQLCLHWVLLLRQAILL